MARSEARIYTEIWEDDDFVVLDSASQRLYMFLLSQPDLAHSGVIPLRERRWARKSKDGSAAVVTHALEELETHFLIVDWDTEEVFVRSLLRRDRIFRQPNVLRAAVDHVPLIESVRILDALACEVARIRTENPDLSVHQDAAMCEVEAALGKRLRSLRGVTSGNPSPNPSGNPSRNPPQGASGRDPLSDPSETAMPDSTGTTLTDIDATSIGSKPGNSIRENDSDYITPGNKGSGNPSGNPSPEVPGVRGGFIAVPRTEDLPRTPGPDPRSPNPVVSADALTLPLAGLAEPDRTGNEQTSTRKRKKPAKPASPATPEEFAEAWNLWPGSDKKQAAEISFANARLLVEQSDLLAAIRAYLAYEKARGTQPKFIPYFATWLNQHRWKDGLKPTDSAARVSPSGHQAFKNPEDDSVYYGDL